jgi:oligoendopeptidase F
MLHGLPTDPKAALDWGWERYDPYFRELTSRPIDTSNIAVWLADWSSLANLINEANSRLNIAVDLHSEDEAARTRFYAFMEKVQEPFAVAEQALKEKLLASGLEPASFAVPLRNMRAEAALFREANVPLDTEHQKASLEYSQIVGNQTLRWEGVDTTLAALVGELKGEPRPIREKGWRLGMARVLADKAAIGAVWTKLMGIRAKIAANADKKDFREYAWQKRLRFDYSPADCASFRDAIEEAVVPAAARVYTRHAKMLRVDSLRPWDVSVDVMRQTDVNVDPFGRPALSPFKDAAELEAGAAAIFGQVDPRLGEYFEAMRREGLYDLANYRGKAPGAYCASWPASKRPFVLMNAAGGAGDVETLLHEMGHAFHAWQVLNSPALPYHQLQDYPTEFAEVASMSMELLGSPYIAKKDGGFYTEEETARARIMHLEQLLLFWPFMAVMDGFQHWAYENHAEATESANCDATWDELWKRFIVGVDWSGLEDARAAGWQRKIHIFHYPFYYVEYGLAQLGAVQVWRNARKDRRAAVSAYLNGLSLGYSVPLPELFAATGAKFAFDAATLREAVELIETGIAEEEERL